MCFDALPVSLFSGIIGKQLAIQFKALNGKFRNLHETLDVPDALPDEIFLAAASMSWGKRFRPIVGAGGGGVPFLYPFGVGLV